MVGLLTRSTLLGPPGTIARGHEFHASRIEPVPEWVPRAYTVRMGRGGPSRAEGYLVGGALMSYVHLHFGSNPQVADHLAGHARAWCHRRMGESVFVVAREEERGHG
jgi:cobyrinic acid a,c-diamide synthase